MLKTSKKESSNNSENTNNYNITKREETLEDLLKEYDEDMKEINNNNKKKTFFKKAKLVLEAFDNIFIDKLIDANIHNKKSEIKEDVIDNAVILCGSLILTIPVLSYFCKRINFFHSLLHYV